jgi:hypothetical protein
MRFLRQGDVSYGGWPIEQSYAQESASRAAACYILASGEGVCPYGLRFLGDWIAAY